MWMIVISARFVIGIDRTVAAGQSQSRRSDQHLHGIDFKNPFTMSKRAVTAQHLVSSRGSSVFIIWKRLAVVEPIGIEPMT